MAHPLAGHTLADVLREAARRYGDAIAVRAPSDHDALETVTHRALEQRAAALRAVALASLQPGETVLLGGRSSVAWIAAFYAIALAGGVAVPLDPESPPAHLARIATAVRPALALGDRAFLARCPAALPRVAFDAAPPAPRTGIPDAPLDPLRAPGDLAVIVFTAGTTGAPKGVMLSHASLVLDARGVVEATRLGPRDVVFAPLPLHHSFALTVVCVAAIGAGVRVELEHRMRQIAGRLRDARPTVILGVPVLYEALLHATRHAMARGRARRIAAALVAVNRWSMRRTGWNLARILLPSVRRALGGRVRYAVSGGAALPPSVAREAALLGLPLIQGYGLSEAGPVVSVPRFDPRRFWWTRHYAERADSVGPPIPGVRVRIEPVAGGAPGEGELLVEGPTLMDGYFEDPERTARVLRDGALHTGDLARIDDEGGIHIRGRLVHTVSTPGGKLVPLEALDEVLAAVDEVAECCVIAEPAPWRLVAFVLPAAAADPTGAASADGVAAKIRAAIAARLRDHPPYERIDAVRLLDAPLPRSAMGKVLRTEVSAGPTFDVERWRRATSGRDAEATPGG